MSELTLFFCIDPFGRTRDKTEDAVISESLSYADSE